jgi:phage-related protein
MKADVLKIDTLDLKSGDFLFWLENFYNLESDIITNDTYNDGVSFNGEKINPRQFLLNGLIKRNVHQNIALLSSALNSKGLKKLTVGVTGMPIRYLNVKAKNMIPQESLRNDFAKISFQIIAPDPYLYANDENVITLGATSNASLTFPFTFPITFGAITGGLGTINNEGNATAYPIIVITGTCDTLTITNTTTGESMSYDVSLGASDVLAIDNRPDTRGVYLNGTNRIDLKVGDWISCEPGDNVFTFERNSIEAKQHCTISLQSRWF